MTSPKNACFKKQSTHLGQGEDEVVAQQLLLNQPPIQLLLSPTEQEEGNGNK